MTNVEIIMAPYNYDHNNFNFIDETKKSRDDHEKLLLNLVQSKKIENIQPLNYHKLIFGISLKTNVWC